MIDDAFVFDCVAHVFNFEKQNALGQPGEMFSNHLYAFHAALTPSGEVHRFGPRTDIEMSLRWQLNGLDLGLGKPKS